MKKKKKIGNLIGTQKITIAKVKLTGRVSEQNRISEQ